MIKNWSILLAFIVLGASASAQVSPNDSVISKKKPALSIDTSLNYDDLFQDFDAFMDSILAPHSYFLGSVSMGKGYFSFESKNSGIIRTLQKLTTSPTLGYYNANGFGFTTTGYIVNDESRLNFYQLSISPSFDYLQNRNFATGVAYTRFITKDSLPFYTSQIGRAHV